MESSKENLEVNENVAENINKEDVVIHARPGERVIVEMESSEDREAQVAETMGDLDNAYKTPKETPMKDKVGSIAYQRGNAPAEPWTSSKNYIPQTSKVGGFRKFLTLLGFGVTAVTAANAEDLKKLPSDTTQEKTQSIGQEKIVFTEANQEVAGITFKGSLNVPMNDANYEYAFVGFDGDDSHNDAEKIEHVKKAAKELGFELANTQDLRTAVAKNGQELINKIGYGMVIDTTHSESDDTMDNNVNDKVSAGGLENFATVNPSGQINRYEKDAILKTGIKYSEYGFLVKKKKAESTTANYTDFVKAK